MSKHLFGGSVILEMPSGGFHGEAEWVAQDILNTGKLGFSTSILFRTNAQSGLLEQYLIKNQIPYVVRGGIPFFARREIYQMVFFLAAAYCNSAEAIVGDGSELKGIGNIPTAELNKPSRYLGAASFNTFSLLYKSTKNPDVVRISRQFEEAVDRRYKPGARDLADMLEQMREQADSPRAALQWAYDHVYENHLKNDTDNSEDSYNNKVSSIDVLMDIADQYSDFKEFVDMCLTRAKGKSQNVDQKDCVQLMTIHAAKGLEFKNVYLVGLNQGYLPHALCSLEEERRIFYVAVTRAEESLVLVSPTGMDFYGKLLSPSYFLGEIADLYF